LPAVHPITTDRPPVVPTVDDDSVRHRSDDRVNPQEGPLLNRTILNRRVLVPAATVASLALVLSACGGNNSGGGGGGGGLSGTITIDGSSTVGPMSAVASELFNEENPDVKITVGESGTGGGFEKFCAGETDMNDASRPIKSDEEAPVCAENGVEYKELVVANDALTVIVPTSNDWATCLTTEQLNQVWGPKAEGKVTNWNQVDPSFPDVPLELFGPGTDSGTFDYFTGEINGEEGVSRADYQPSEDDNVIIQGVSGSKGGLGYLGYTYYEQNTDKVNAVQVDSGGGCVSPSAETVQDGTYTPLARPLFIYPSIASMSDNAAFASFVDFFVANDATISETAQYVPLSDSQKTTLDSELADLKSAAGL
jgi:phosphate transport system substrate-binding protein